jgi:uncharacterized delta-60 repeat protein
VSRVRPGLALAALAFAAGLIAGAAPALAADGSLDPAFGGAAGQRGLVTHFPDREFVVGGVAVQPDGRVLVAGGIDAEPGTSARRNLVAAVVRLRADGSLDPSFGDGGLATMEFSMAPNQEDIAYDLALAPDGRIVLAGQTAVNPGSLSTTSSSTFIARFLPNGAPDPSWWTDGAFVVNLSGSGPGDGARAVTIDGQGRVLVAAFVRPSPEVARFAIMRFTASGERDHSFGPAEAGGVVEVGYGADETAVPRDIAVDDEGRIVVVGSSIEPLTTTPPIFTHESPAIVRLLDDGSRDQAFAGPIGSTTGSFKFPAFGGASFESVAHDEEGDILMFGTVDTIIPLGPGELDLDWYFARLRGADGRPDETFVGPRGDAAGYFSLPVRAFGGGFPDDPGEVGHAAVLDDRGRIVAAGLSGSMALARLDESGAIDPTFVGDRHGGAPAGEFGRVFFGPGGLGAQALAVDGAGRLVVAGSRGVAGAGFTVARLLGEDLPPETMIKRAPGRRVVTRKARVTLRFRLASDEAGSTFRCALRGQGTPKRLRRERKCPGKLAVKVRTGAKGGKPRRLRFAARAVDATGTADPSPARRTFRVVRR